MKKLTTLLLGLMLALCIHAQITPAAANYEKTFWSNIERMKTLDPATNRGAYTNSLATAESNLKSVKKYAPGYDVSKHEAAYNEAKAKADGEKAGRDAAMERKGLEDKIASLESNSGNESVLANSYSGVAATQEKVDKFKAKFPTENTADLDQRLASLSKKLGTIEANRPKEEEQAPRVSRGVAEEAVDGQVPSNGVANDYHQKNLGKAVFTKEWHDAAEMNEGYALKSTTVFQPLTIRFYMDKSLTNYGLAKFPNAKPAEIREHTKIKIVWYVDGKKASDSYTFPYLTGTDLDKFTTFSLELFEPRGQYAISYPSWSQMVLDFGGQIKKGTHQIKVELFDVLDLNGGAVIGPISTGEISMNFNTDLINPADPNVCLPKVYKSDAAIESKMLEAFKAKYSYTPTSYRIISDWSILHHPVTGLPTGRTIEGTFTSSEGGKCFSQGFEFRQDYNGSSYSGPYIVSNSTPRGEIHCGCVK